MVTVTNGPASNGNVIRKVRSTRLLPGLTSRLKFETVPPLSLVMLAAVMGARNAPPRLGACAVMSATSRSPGRVALMNVHWYTLPGAWLQFGVLSRPRTRLTFPLVHDVHDERAESVAGIRPSRAPLVPHRELVAGLLKVEGFGRNRS